VKKLIFIAIALLLFSGCDQQKEEKIQWQMPLEAPEDQHGSEQQLTFPAWAAATPGTAELVWLQKTTTKKVSTKLALGGRSQVNGFDVQLIGLASGLKIKKRTFINDENVDNPAAFVEIKRDNKVIYRGWLYVNFPELFGIDDPEWKVWVKDITLRPASEKAST